MNELVKVQNGKPVTNSVLVAQKFHKRHTHVIRAIREISNTAEIGPKLGASPMYAEATYYDDMNRLKPMYLMDRDGFSLLVMGFTGQQAMKFKVDFINAFNEMEGVIKNGPSSNLRVSAPEELLLQSVQLLIDHKNRIDNVERRVEKIEARSITNPDYFTIAGYAMMIKRPVNLTIAKRAGYSATVICQKNGIPVDTTPDPRFGRVNMYPREILQHVFETMNI